MLNLVKTLYFKYKHYFLFLTGGLLNTLITFTIFLLIENFISYQLAYFITYFIGIVISYFYNIKVVFKVNTSLKSGFLWPFIYITNYFIGAMLMHFLVEILKIPSYVSVLIITTLLIPLTYIFSKLIATNFNNWNFYKK